MKIPSQLTIDRSTLLCGKFSHPGRPGCGCVVGQLMMAMGWSGVIDDYLPYREHLALDLGVLYAKNDRLVEKPSTDLEADVIRFVGKLGCELQFVGEWPA